LKIIHVDGKLLAGTYRRLHNVLLFSVEPVFSKRTSLLLRRSFTARASDLSGVVLPLAVRFQVGFPGQFGMFNLDLNNILMWLLQDIKYLFNGLVNKISPAFIQGTV
jgi:hypothetical protein